MIDIKLYIAESQGISQNYIKTLKVVGKGVLVQFEDEARGVFTSDHENDEYCYFHDSYGFKEIYEFIKAKNLKDATLKAKELNKRLEND